MYTEFQACGCECSIIWMISYLLHTIKWTNHSSLLFFSWILVITMCFVIMAGKQNWIILVMLTNELFKYWMISNHWTDSDWLGFVLQHDLISYHILVSYHLWHIWRCEYCNLTNPSLCTWRQQPLDWIDNQWIRIKLLFLLKLNSWMFESANFVQYLQFHTCN